MKNSKGLSCILILSNSFFLQIYFHYNYFWWDRERERNCVWENSKEEEENSCDN